MQKQRMNTKYKNIIALTIFSVRPQEKKNKQKRKQNKETKKVNRKGLYLV
jgi:hypothetical protein